MRVPGGFILLHPDGKAAGVPPTPFPRQFEPSRARRVSKQIQRGLAVFFFSRPVLVIIAYLWTGVPDLVHWYLTSFFQGMQALRGC